MSKHARNAVGGSELTPAGVTQLMDVVADRTVHPALSDMEQTIARLRAEAGEACEARRVLANTPPTVLRDALLLRAARIETAR